MVTYSTDRMVLMNVVTVFIQETCARILRVSFLIPNLGHEWNHPSSASYASISSRFLDIFSHFCSKIEQGQCIFACIEC